MHGSCCCFFILTLDRSEIHLPCLCDHPQCSWRWRRGLIRGLCYEIALVPRRKKTKKSYHQSTSFLRSLTFGLCDMLPQCKRLTLDEYLTWIAFAVSKRKRGDEYLMRNKSKKLLSVETMWLLWGLKDGSCNLGLILETFIAGTDWFQKHALVLRFYK